MKSFCFMLSNGTVLGVGGGLGTLLEVRDGTWLVRVVLEHYMSELTVL